MDTFQRIKLKMRRLKGEMDLEPAAQPARSGLPVSLYRLPRPPEMAISLRKWAKMEASFLYRLTTGWSVKNPSPPKSELPGSGNEGGGGYWVWGQMWAKILPPAVRFPIVKSTFRGPKCQFFSACGGLSLLNISIFGRRRRKFWKLPL